MITQNIEYENTLNEMKLYFRWSNATYNQYLCTISKYIKIQECTFNELIQEALNDEKNNVKIQQRQIKKRLIKYILYYNQQGNTNGTIRQYLSMICKVYKYHDIEIPEIPPIPQDLKETFEDVPTPQQIKKAIDNSTLKTKAYITLIASSGLSRIEVANLTVKHFIEATSEYHNETNILKVIEALKNKDNIIPTWYFTRQKTKIKGYTFSSPESTMFILHYLQRVLNKKLLSNNDKLFGVNAEGITSAIRRVNYQCGYAKTKKHSFLHPHVLRTYFATTLNNEGCDFLTVEFLLGHRIKDVTASYYKANPEKLKMKYERYVKHLCFTLDLKEVTISDDELLELEELREYKRDMDKRLRNLEELLKVS